MEETGMLKFVHTLALISLIVFFARIPGERQSGETAVTTP